MFEKIHLVIFIYLSLALTAFVQAAPIGSCSQYLSERAIEVRKAMKQAKAMATEGRQTEAIAQLENLLSAHPNDLRALTFLARLQYQTKDFEKAYINQSLVLLHEPNYKEAAYFTMAQILRSLKKETEAQNYLQEIIKHNPQHSVALGMLARINLDQNQLEKAYDLLGQKLEVQPHDTHALTYLAEYHLKRSDLKSALKISQRLVNENKPRQDQQRAPMAYRVGLALRAKIYSTSAETASKALEDLQTLAKLMKEPLPWMTLVKAEAFFRLGQMQESQKELLSLVRDSVRLDPVVVSALIRIEMEGKDISLAQALDSSFHPVVQALLRQLEPKELAEVFVLAKDKDWEFVPTTPVPSLSGHVSVYNYFWSQLYSMPVDTQTRESTF